MCSRTAAAPLRPLLRRRLASAQAGAGREGAAPGAGGAVRPRAREPGADHRVRSRRLPRPLLRAPLPDRPRRSCRCSSRWSRDLRRMHPEDHPDVLEIESIVTATRAPAHADSTPSPSRSASAQREKEIVKRRLDALVTGSAAARDALERSLRAINGERGRPAQLRRAGGAAGRPGLPPQLLARRRRGDQLPPLLRHQRPGRRSGSRSAQVLGGGPRPRLRAAARGQGDGAAHRPRRRSAGPAPLLQDLCARRRRPTSWSRRS